MTKRKKGPSVRQGSHQGHLHMERSNGWSSPYPAQSAPRRKKPDPDDQVVIEEDPDQFVQWRVSLGGLSLFDRMADIISSHITDEMMSEPPCRGCLLYSSCHSPFKTKIIDAEPGSVVDLTDQLQLTHDAEITE